MRRRAILHGGSCSGDALVFEFAPLPLNLTIDGEEYVLGQARRPARYYAVAPRRTARRFTAERKRAFVEHIRAGATVQEACHATAVSSACVYRHRRVDPVFAAALERAKPAEMLADDGLPEAPPWRPASPLAVTLNGHA